MIRFCLRCIAYFLLAGAFSLAVIDGTRFVDSGRLVPTSLERIAAALLAAQPDALAAVAKDHGFGAMFEPVVVTLLGLPATLVLAASALLLFLIARRRKQKLGFEI